MNTKYLAPLALIVAVAATPAIARADTTTQPTTSTNAQLKPALKAPQAVRDQAALAGRPAAQDSSSAPKILTAQQEADAWQLAYDQTYTVVHMP